MELLARRKDGTEFPVEIGLGPMVTKEGVRVSTTIVDITERKQIEEQLRLSRRMEAIGKLAGGVAHDFNNLLGVILGSADAVLEKLPPEHPARRKLEVITQAGCSAADLTRQLLAFARQQMLQPRVINLKELIERTEVLLRRLIGENIQFAISLEPTLGQVKADPGQIEQVLINLAVNARDAMPQGGHLRIEARNVQLDDSYKQTHSPVNPGPYVMITVEDSGCGMNRETQARIFDPFFTYLRRADESAQPTKPDALDTTLLRGCETILLVEDSESLRDMVREYLKSMGYTVLEAASGQDALQQAKGFDATIHLLLTDVVMPEMGGPELAGQLGTLRPGIKVIFTSGYSEAAIARQDVLDPAVAFIQKPYRPKALARKIREVLGELAPSHQGPR